MNPQYGYYANALLQNEQQKKRGEQAQTSAELDPAQQALQSGQAGSVAAGTFQDVNQVEALSEPTGVEASEQQGMTGAELFGRLQVQQQNDDATSSSQEQPIEQSEEERIQEVEGIEEASANDGAQGTTGVSGASASGGGGANAGNIKERFQATKAIVESRVQLSQRARNQKLYVNSVQILQKAFKAIDVLNMDIFDLMQNSKGQGLPPEIAEVMDGLGELSDNVVNEFTNTLSEMGVEVSPDEAKALLAKDTKMGVRGEGERNDFHQEFHGFGNEEMGNLVASATDKINQQIESEAGEIEQGLTQQEGQENQGSQNVNTQQISQKIENIKALHGVAVGLFPEYENDLLGGVSGSAQRIDALEQRTEELLKTLGLEGLAQTDANRTSREAASF